MELILQDNFNESNGTNLNGKSLSIGGTWTALSGTWAVSDGKAIKNANATTWEAIVCDAATDCEITLVINNAGYGGPCIRVKDNENLFFARLHPNDNALEIFKKEASGFAQIAVTYTTYTYPCTITLSAIGDTITASIGEVSCSATSSFNIGETKVGIKSYATDQLFDDFVVQSTAILNETMSGGVGAGGVAEDEYIPDEDIPIEDNSIWIPQGCFCNSFSEDTSGGVRCSGYASVNIVTTRTEGGVKTCGSALVDIAGDFGDGFASIWHLQEQGSGTANEYRDSVGNKHGQGGGGIASYVPTREDGIYCLYCQTFDGTNDFISLPKDTIGNQPFAVSAWVKIDGTFQNRVFYSRGRKDGLNQAVFSLGHTVASHIQATFHFDNGGTNYSISAFSLNRLAKSQWYHVAVSYDGSYMRVYLNGQLDNQSSAPAYTLKTPSNSGYAGRLDGGGFLEGSLIELRLHQEPRSVDYWSAEYHNWCDSDFVLFAGEESPTSPITV